MVNQNKFAGFLVAQFAGKFELRISNMMMTATPQQLISTVSLHSTTVVFTLVILFLVFIYWYGFGRFQHFKEDGLRGPKPAPFVGNLLDLYRSKWQLHLMLDSYYKKYGRVFGMYLNSRPTVVVSDPDTVKQILVKDFAKFHDRQVVVEFPSPQDSFMTGVKGERWKFIRGTLTPSFTSGKMRPMSGLMNRVADGLISVIKAKSKDDPVVDFVTLQQRVTMEAILAAAFGVDANTEQDDYDKITEKAKKLFRRAPVWVNILMMMPLSTKFMKYIPWAFSTIFDPITKVARAIVEQRKNGGTKRQDVLQFMLDAQQTPDSQGRVLTDDEIVAQSVVFMAAGYETSSTTLALATYYLALHPKIQDKLYNEIVTCWPEDSMPDYDIVQKMLYLDQVISETLRICPPGFFVLRTCNENCMINGTQFHNGYDVIVPTYSMHHDPEFWDDPEKFDPDRFSPEAKASHNPYVYLPFGHGPRNCIGMRFAQMEMKIVLARLLKEFKLEIAEETPVPIILASEITLAPDDPLKLRVVKRE